MNFELAKILVLDDDLSFLEQMPDILDGFGRVDAYQTIDQGLAAVSNHFYDIAILDLNFANDSRSGLDVFKRIMALDRGVDVILVTGETDARRIFELVNAGIHHFVPKPASVDEIRARVASLLEDRAYRKRAIQISQQINSGKSASVLIGSSSQMNQVREQIARIVQSGVKDVLLLGETGTGKEVIARYIVASADTSGRFIPVNCAAFNENLIQSELFGHVRGAFTGAERDKQGVFESAMGGHVFLDEIGDMPLSQQPKLLRTLQERKIVRVGEVEEKAVNFRTISATHLGLKKAVEEGRFREDLYFRISKETIIIPSLRERLDDIRELALHFISLQSKRCQITDDAINLLRSYAWPGNVRELQSVIDRAIIRADKGIIRSAQIAQVLPELASLSSNKLRRAVMGVHGMQLIAVERKRFYDAIVQAAGNRDVAAKNLGLSRSTFFRKAKELGLVKDRKQALGLGT